MARQRIPCLAEAGAGTCTACLSMYECLLSISMVASQHSSSDITMLHLNQEPKLAAGFVLICLRLVTFTNVTAYVHLGTLVSLCMQVDQLVHAQELMLRLSAECNGELQAKLIARKM